MNLELVSPHPITKINDEALAEWIEYRTEKKKPLSALALKKTKNLLRKFGFAHQQHIVDVCVMNDWQGLHPVEMPKIIASPSRSTNIQDDLTDRSWA
jgi:hypothetical protein